MDHNLESDELYSSLSYTFDITTGTSQFGGSNIKLGSTQVSSQDSTQDKKASPTLPTTKEVSLVPVNTAESAVTENLNDNVVEGDVEGEKFFDPVTGEQISKNAFKKLQKGGVKKEKKEKPVAAPKAEGEKKEKKKVKEAEVIFTDATPEGEKKILDGVFPATYQPKYVEAAWQSWWEKSGFYKPNVEAGLQAEAKDKFIMVIPPPNVTGSLHLGHALTTAIEDTITRYNRMKGRVTLWVPGTDHAGIATQSVVEKRLKKESNLSRHDLGRDEFVKRVWEWKHTYGGKITNQIRSLGASVDWSRESFTMDANLSRAVTEAFVRFHEDGLLYRLVMVMISIFMCLCDCSYI